MTADECIAELEVAIAEKVRFLRDGTPVRHALAASDLGKFIGFVSYGGREAVFHCAVSELEVVRRANVYEYTKRSRSNQLR